MAKSLSLRWRRGGLGVQHCFTADNVEIGRVEKRDNCGYWYPYIGENDDPEGMRYDTAGEAKAHVERTAARRFMAASEPDALCETILGAAAILAWNARYHAPKHSDDDVHDAVEIIRRAQMIRARNK